MRIIEYDPSWKKELVEILEEADREFFSDKRLKDEIENRPHGKLIESFAVKEKDNHCLLLIDDNEIIGFICYRVLYGIGETYKTYVMPRHRRKGLGLILCETALGNMRGRGCRIARCEVDIENSAMLKLKFRQGYYIKECQEESMDHQWIRLEKVL